VGRRPKLETREKENKIEVNWILVVWVYFGF